MRNWRVADAYACPNCQVALKITEGFGGAFSKGVLVLIPCCAITVLAVAALVFEVDTLTFIDQLGRKQPNLLGGALILFAAFTVAQWTTKLWRMEVVT